jgi:hypothetical protein
MTGNWNSTASEGPPVACSGNVSTWLPCWHYTTPWVVPSCALTSGKVGSGGSYTLGRETPGLSKGGCFFLFYEIHSYFLLMIKMRLPCPIIKH